MHVGEDEYLSGPSLNASESLMIDIVHDAIGARAGVNIRQWYVRDDTYVVMSMETTRPALRLVVKLEVPGKRPNRRFDSMATIARMVRGQTAVPTFDVIAVDVTRSRWPWNVLIVTELPGVTWAQLHPRLETTARASGQRQIGRAAAHIHTLAFDCFGAIEPNGAVAEYGGSVAALQARAAQRIRTPAHRNLMLELLESRARVFATLPGPRLAHEDMNPYNLLFEMRDGEPLLSGVLDFESAWAGVAESDLARLELWRLTRGSALRDAYAEIAAVSEQYALRRPILQLLWCLEYADDHTSARHQADTDQVCADLGIPPIRLT
jgi:Ser/Thr protein kinase RdoA (MazF antagonist)